MATLQEQMAGPSRPRFNGWLTMAPEMDPPPVATTSTFVPAAPVVRLPALEQPTASTHGFGMLGQATRLPQRKKKRATFSIGSPGLSDDETAVSTERGGGSGRSSRASSDGPDFDVRASFAPMPVWGQSRASAQPNTQDTAPAQTVQDTQHEDEPDTGGLSFAGRQWKGKTVHAVEQELEALRDTKLMSHAPDPAYLASRLEGLRRNLEVEERRPTYVQYDEDYMMDDDELPITAIPDPSNHPYQHIYGADLALQMGVRAMPALAHRPVSNASSVSLAEGETPNDLAAGLEFDTSLHQMDATAAAAATAAAGDHIKIHDPHAIDMIGSTTFFSPTKAIDPAARAAALEARIEIRTLRRSDLDQVRDLHAFHGDLDRCPQPSPVQTTQTSPNTAAVRVGVSEMPASLASVANPLFSGLTSEPTPVII
ncbi:hypothetical protein BCV70DRAFT_204808 [Testicularia cyperi]|uniref:Uncharacterized protein n=1 Tax=Testicularia cyperi TaxID=1882483 RepID=A0A317XW13_9BASI|nr:hypothetical protein BCV70DRAFT_204808 [Testicularia cyperi]